MPPPIAYTLDMRLETPDSPFGDGGALPNFSGIAAIDTDAGHGSGSGIAV